MILHFTNPEEPKNEISISCMIFVAEDVHHIIELTLKVLGHIFIKLS